MNHLAYQQPQLNYRALCPQCGSPAASVVSIGFTVRQPDGVFHTYRVDGAGAVGMVADQTFSGDVASVTLCCHQGHEWHQAFIEDHGGVVIRDVPVRPEPAKVLELPIFDAADVPKYHFGGVVDTSKADAGYWIIATVWQQLIINVEKVAPIIASWLKAGRPLGIDNGVLRIDFDESHSLVARALALPSNMVIVVTKLAELLKCDTAGAQCCVNGEAVPIGKT